MPTYSRPTTEKPDLNYLQALRREALETWAARRTVDDDLWALYTQQNGIKVPDHISAEVIRSGLAAETVKQNKGIFLIEEPQIRARPARSGAKPQEEADARTAFLEALPRALEKQDRTEVLEPCIRDLCVFGRMGWRKMYAPHHWLNHPKSSETGDYENVLRDFKEQAKIPIVWRRLPADQTFPIYGDDGVQELLTIRQVTVRDLRARYANFREETQAGVDRRRIDLASKVELCEWMNRDWVAYWTDYKIGNRSGVLLQVFDHKLGEIPAVWVEGDEPHALSGIYDMREQVQTLDNLLTQFGTAIRIWCWPTPVINLLRDTIPIAQKAAKDGRPTLDWDLKSGKPLVLMQDGAQKESVSFLVWPTQGPDIQTLMARVQNFAERAGLAAMYGGPNPGDSGYLYNSAIQTAKLKVEHQERAINNGLETDARLNLKLVEVIGEEVAVYYSSKDESRQSGYITLEPAQINGYYKVEAQIQKVLPQNMAANAQIALWLAQPVPGVGEPLADIDYIRKEFLGVQNLTRMKTELALQRYRNQPEIQEFITKRAVQEADEEITQEQIQKLLGSVTPGSVPPALQQAMSVGVQGAPNVPGQNYAPSANGQITGAEAPPPPANAPGMGVTRPGTAGQKPTRPGGPNRNGGR